MSSEAPNGNSTYISSSNNSLNSTGRSRQVEKEASTTEVSSTNRTDDSFLRFLNVFLNHPQISVNSSYKSDATVTQYQPPSKQQQSHQERQKQRKQANPQRSII